MVKQLTLVTCASIIIFAVSTFAFASTDLKAYEINDTIGVIYNDTLYIPKKYAFYKDIQACGYTFNHIQEGLYFDAYKPVLDKKKEFKASKCKEYNDKPDEFTPLVEVKSEAEIDKLNYKEQSKYRMMVRLSDIYKKIYSERKYKPLRKGEYGRLYKKPNGTVVGVYVDDDKYGRMIFAVPEGDVEALNGLKENDKLFENYYKVQDENEAKMKDEEAKQIQEQEQEQEEKEEEPNKPKNKK